MNPYVAAQIDAVIEGIRLLETFVTAPLGLTSDISMLRQSIPLPEAADLSRDDLRKRRSANISLTDDRKAVALQCIENIWSSLTVLDGLTHRGGSPLSAEWTERARLVLARAEQRAAGDLRRDTASKVRGLYVIVDPNVTRGRPVTDIAEAALRGGAAIIQLRDKTGDKGQVLATARQIRSMCREHGSLFIVNDDPSLALSSDAHGLHLGQGDIPLGEARRVLNLSQIVGSSNNTTDEIANSLAQGADYLAVGAIYPTATAGKDARAVVGVEMIGRAKDTASQPVVAIGGINRGNIGEVIRAGVDSVCVVSAVTLAGDPEAAARDLSEAFHDARS
jgi:thiamine-phosphate pyrophosphorylase